MMIRKDVAAPILIAEGPVHFPLQMQLGFQPERQCRSPRPQAPRRKRTIGLTQAVELGQRLVIEPPIIEIYRRNAAFAQAILDRIDRKR